MLDTAPQPGFVDLALQSQSAFRIIMQAMAEPGRIFTAPEPVDAVEPLNPVAAMVALTLCDYDTPVWLDQAFLSTAAITNFLSFHTGAPLTEQRDAASFAFISNSKKIGDLRQFALGTDIYPDRSTTLIVQVEALTNATGARLSGPGIETARHLGIAPLSEGFWEMAKANHALYPRGVDFIFCSPKEIACLPRSTRIEERI